MKCLGALVFFLASLSTGLASDFYSFEVEDHLGEKVSLEKFRGKVTLVVNVASLCGYTDNTYRALTKIHDILGYEGFFSVVAFPCNQFGDQEPEDAESIYEAMKKEYGIEFPIFNKIDVIGRNANPAFRYLVQESSKTPEWNFYKYLVNADGEVVDAWGTRTELEEIFPDVQREVEKAKLAAQDQKKDAGEEGKTQENNEETKPEEDKEGQKEEL